MIGLGRALRMFIMTWSEPEDVRIAYRRRDQSNPTPLELFEDRKLCIFLQHYSHVEKIIIIEGFLEASDVATKMGEASAVRKSSLHFSTAVLNHCG